MTFEPDESPRVRVLRPHGQEASYQVTVGDLLGRVEVWQPKGRAIVAYCTHPVVPPSAKTEQSPKSERTAIDGQLLLPHASTMTSRTMIALGFVVLGCGSAGAGQVVIKHAATEWQCPPGDIQLERLDSETYRVEGCERHADYSCPTNRSGAASECERVSGT